MMDWSSRVRAVAVQLMEVGEHFGARSPACRDVAGWRATNGAVCHGVSLA